MTGQLPDTDIAPATVCDLTDMIESRYSGQITPRDLDVAKVAFAAGAAAERERIREYLRQLVAANAGRDLEDAWAALLVAIRTLDGDQ